MPNILPESDKIWSIEAEAAVLGSMIYDPTCIPEVLAVIRATEMFYMPENQAIFDALVNLHINEAQIDAVMLRDELKQRNQLKRVGGAEYLGKIMDNVPSAANAVYYAKIVRERHQYRQMVRVVQDIRKVPDEIGTVNEQIEEIHRLALSLQPQREDQVFSYKEHIGEAVVNMADGGKDCVPTGFGRLDSIIHGFYPWELILLAGRPGHGKSCLAQDIANFVAKESGPVVIFSLEMAASALMQRSICAAAMVNAERWSDHMPQQEFDDAVRASEGLSKLDIQIYETVRSPEKITAIVSVLKRSKPPKLIVVDNVQIMQTEPPIPHEYDRLCEISQSLKGMAMKFKVPVLAISHLNREVEKRTNHMPRLSDLRGSGTLEQDADLILLLHREDQYRKLENPNIEPDKFDGLAQVVVAKNRRGRSGIATLLFREEFTTFRNMAPEYLGQGA